LDLGKGKPLTKNNNRKGAKDNENCTADQEEKNRDGKFGKPKKAEGRKRMPRYAVVVRSWENVPLGWKKFKEKIFGEHRNWPCEQGNTVFDLFHHEKGGT